MTFCLTPHVKLGCKREMTFFHFCIIHIVAVLQLQGSPAQSLPSVATNSTFKVVPFQEVWERSFCRTIEKLVDVVQEYPGEVEHIFSPSCVPLVRCAGCCGDENLECHPVDTYSVTIQLLKIKPAEGHREHVNMTFVEHKACECRLKKLKNGRQRQKGRGRKRKERRRMKYCEMCQPPRR